MPQVARSPPAGVDTRSAVPGGVRERPNRHAWKACVGKLTVGSNPTVSATGRRARPDGTAIAASANVVAIGIAARAGQAISFWKFTRYGIIVTLLSTALAWLYVWLRYF